MNEISFSGAWTINRSASPFWPRRSAAPVPTATTLTSTLYLSLNIGIIVPRSPESRIDVVVASIKSSSSDSCGMVQPGTINNIHNKIILIM